MPSADPTYAAIAAFADELVAAGLRHVCISPGARSTPLTLTLATHPRLRAWSHIDERSGSFFALGIAKATRSPVAVVCTSGTAAANFFPAVIEAAYAHVPLVVLTADRPAELRDCGAGQAIDQLKLYGSHVKWFVEVGDAKAGERYFRTLGSRAMAAARATPAGPVHLNFPFREPLVPVGWPGAGADGSFDRDDACRPCEPFSRTTVHTPVLLPDTGTVCELAEALAARPRGLVVCGAYDGGASHAAAVTRLAELLRYPVLADPTSQLRSGPHDTSRVVDTYDALLRDDSFASRVAPEVVVRIGPMPASKALASYLRCHPDSLQIVIDPCGPWNDPLHMAARIIRCEPLALCEAVIGRLEARPVRPVEDRHWLPAWLGAQRFARAAIAERLVSMVELFEGKVFTQLERLLPDGACLYVGNSMAVRDLEAFWPAGRRAVRVLCNRGANGIDGFVSSGLGAAAVTEGPLVVVTGDLAFYHDMNGLLAAKRYGLRAVIVVLNNDGGGIFSYLPQARCGDAFAEYFLTPHGLDFRAAAELYGCAFVRIASWEQFSDAVAGALRAPGTTIIEVPIDRARSVELHQAIWAAARLPEA